MNCPIVPPRANTSWSCPHPRNGETYVGADILALATSCIPFIYIYIYAIYGTPPLIKGLKLELGPKCCCLPALGSGMYRRVQIFIFCPIYQITISGPASSPGWANKDTVGKCTRRSPNITNVTATGLRVKSQMFDQFLKLSSNHDPL